ncbi:hypothetical protein OE88DRAFT_1663285 [Heliocybe sulcata]|uniref:Uncharacterized protein n=1 Tax=Heliocybe sulcata TaxID=5364 RepID=A0A5C3MUJ7_9AGAM|nr:hypothetical protein OE88DRAFT_1663285 [Heliocybe sulcata]
MLRAAGRHIALLLLKATGVQEVSEGDRVSLAWPKWRKRPKSSRGLQISCYVVRRQSGRFIARGGVTAPPLLECS